MELRLDLLPDIDVVAAMAACPVPVLATLRSAAEGGNGTDDPAARAEILGVARNAGAALIDLEFARDAALITSLGLPPEQVILSWHDPKGTPEDLVGIAERMMEKPARWIKLVVVKQ